MPIPNGTCRAQQHRATCAKQCTRTLPTTPSPAHAVSAPDLRPCAWRACVILNGNLLVGFVGFMGYRRTHGRATGAGLP